MLEMAVAELASSQGRSDENVEMSLDFFGKRLAEMRTPSGTTPTAADLLGATAADARRAALFKRIIEAGVPSEAFLEDVNGEIADLLQLEANGAAYKGATARALYGQSLMARLGLGLEATMLPQSVVDDLAAAYAYARGLTDDEVTKVNLYLFYKNHPLPAAYDGTPPARPATLSDKTEKIVAQLFGGNLERLRTKQAGEVVTALKDYRKALSSGQTRLKGEQAFGSLYAGLAVMAAGSGASQAEGDVQNLLILQAFAYLAASLQLPVNRIATVYQSFNAALATGRTAYNEALAAAQREWANWGGAVPVPFLNTSDRPPSFTSMLMNDFSALFPKLTTKTSLAEVADLNRGRRLGIETALAGFDMKAAHALAAEGSNKLLTGQNLSKSIGRNGIFVIADLLSLAGSIYNLIIDQKNGVDGGKIAVDVVGGVLPNALWLTADVLDTFASGTKVLRAVMGMAVAGIVISVGTSTYQIYAAVKKFETDRDSVSNQANVAQSVINTVLALATLATMVAAPPVGIILGALSAILPNFGAAAASIDYMKKGQELAAKGLSHDAEIAYAYQQSAGLDALSILGWLARLGGADPLGGQARLVNADPAYYGDATLERLHWGLVGNVEANGRSALVNSLLDSMGSQFTRIRYLLGSSDMFTYFANDTVFTNSLYSVLVSKATDGRVSVADVGTSSGRLTQSQATDGAVSFTAADFARTPTAGGPEAVPSELVLIDRGSGYLGTMKVEVASDGKRRVYNVLAGNVALTGKDNGDSFVVSGSKDITIKIAAQEAPYTDHVFIRPPDAKDASKGVAIQLDNYVNVAAVHGTPGADTVTGAAKGQFYDLRGGGDVIVMSGDESRVNVADSDYAKVTLTGREAVVYGNGGSTIAMKGADGFVAIDFNRANAFGGVLQGSSDDALKVSAAEGTKIQLISTGAAVYLGSQYRDRAGLVSFVYATVTSLPSTSDGWFGTYISDGKNTNQVTLTGHTFKAFSFGAGDETLSLTNAGEIFAAMGDGASSVRLAGDTAATLTTGMKSSFTLTLEQTAGFTGYLQGTGSVNISGIGSDNRFLVGGGGVVSISANQGQALYVELADAEGNGALGGVVNLSDAKRGMGAAVTINLQEVESDRVTVRQMEDASGKVLQIQTWKSDPSELALQTPTSLNLVETVNYRGTEGLDNAYLAWTDASDGLQTVVSLASLVQSLAAFGVAGGGAKFGHTSFLANDVATLPDLALAAVVAQTAA